MQEALRPAILPVSTNPVKKGHPGWGSRECLSDDQVSVGSRGRDKTATINDIRSDIFEKVISF